MKINSRYKNLNINLDNDNLIDQMEIESIDEMFNDKKEENDIEIEKNKLIKKQYYRALNHMKDINKKNYCI